MIGVAPERRGWAEAALLSLLLHAGAAAWLIRADMGGDPDTLSADREAPPLIEITAITPLVPGAVAEGPEADAGVPDDPANVAVALPRPILTPLSPAGAPDEAGSKTGGNGASETSAEAETPLLSPVTPAVTGPNAALTALPPEAIAQGRSLAPDSHEAAAEDAASLARAEARGERTTQQDNPHDDFPLAAPPPVTPTDPRLVPMLDRIRARLADPCLLALPRMEGDTLHLEVLSDSDRNISAMTADLTAGLAAGTGRSAVLLDPRQCPAIAFARRDPHYPVLPVSLLLDTPALASGETLRGRIEGAAGRSLTLLLIDDNGVVHDLQPFLQRSAAAAEFAVPLTRTGRARDTQHLLVAIASDRRPRAVTDRAGQLASQVFEALSAEIGQAALVGVASVVVR